jgi:UDP:flavonoid glycosyltransferase YjiC (YdhE family)
VLFVVGSALGHVGRLSVPARRLSAMRDVTITFVAPAHGRYTRKVVEDEFEFVPIEIPESARRMPAYEFAGPLEDLLAARAPDLIVHDMCPLRWLSAVRFPSTPRVMVTNFYFTSVVAGRTFQAELFDEVADELGRVRAEKGLPPLRSVFDLYQADRVLLADPAPLLARHGPLPANHRGCGISAWTPDCDLPDELVDADDVLVLAMGSTGHRGLARSTIQQIEQWCGSSTTIYVGSRAGGMRRQGIADAHYAWLPLRKLLARARAVISQGGAGSTYLALAAGVPVVVLPLHNNHRILGEIIEAAGLGVCLPEGTPLEQIAADYDAISRNVRAFAAGLDPRDGADEIAAQIADVL